MSRRGTYGFDGESTVKKIVIAGGVLVALLVVLALVVRERSSGREAGSAAVALVRGRDGTVADGGNGARARSGRSFSTAASPPTTAPSTRAAALGAGRGGVLGGHLQRRQGGEPLGRDGAARSGCRRCGGRSRSWASRSLKRERPIDLGAAVPGPLRRPRAHRVARPGGAGDVEERHGGRPRPSRRQRLRRRRPGVGRPARRRRPRGSADPGDRAAADRTVARRPRAALRHGPHPRRRLHRLRRVEPGEERRQRRDPRHPRRRGDRAALRRPPLDRAPLAHRGRADAARRQRGRSSPGTASSSSPGPRSSPPPTAASTSTTRATAGFSSPGRSSSASISSPAAAARPTATSRRGSRSPAASPPATVAASPAGWSSTSTRARPPTPLDAPAAGVDYSIPFGLIASIAPSGREQGAAGRVRVTLQDGEELRLEPAGRPRGEERRPADLHRRRPAARVRDVERARTRRLRARRPPCTRRSRSSRRSARPASDPATVDSTHRPHSTHTVLTLTNSRMPKTPSSRP